MALDNALKALILDMDGVLWRADQPIGDLPATFARIRQMGLRFTLATNNATLSAGQYVEKLAGFGVTLEPDQVVTSAGSAARYLQRRYPQGGPVFIVGETGLQRELAGCGFYPAEEGSQAGCLAVVAGLDRTITYDKLARAAALARAGVLFVGTNPDLTYPAVGGLAPGAGSVLAFISAASGVQPVITGKPQPELYLLALERMSVSPQETLVIGDRLDTDIVGAQALGCRTGLVLTGVSTDAEAQAWQPSLDWTAPDLAGLLEMIT